MKKQYIRIWFVIACLFLLTGCNREELVTPEPDSVTTEVVFTLQTPSQLLTTTRSGVTAIETLNVLAFENDGSDNYVLADRITSYTVEDTSDANEKRATVKFPVSSQGERYKMVLLANVEEELLGSLHPGDPLSVLEQLIHESQTPFQADSPLPMWGESATDITIEGLNVSVSVRMLRMLARVDMIMNLSDPDLFQLKEVWVYHTNTSGRIVPDTSNLNAEGSAETTTLPAGVARFDTSEAFMYEAGENNYIRGIYLYELNQDENEAKATAPGLVIGGIYDQDTQITYYRLNLVARVGDDPDNKEEIYPDLLRNHLYYLSINEIYGKGYDDKEVALASSPSLSGSMLPFNEGETEIYFDGDNYLSIGESTYEFPRAEVTGTLKVTSTQAWTFEVESQAASWLSGSKVADGIEFQLTENTGTETRQGYLTIHSGEFRAEVLFIQTTDEHIALSIRDRYGNDVTELVFSSCSQDLSVTAQELTVSWAPDNVVCIISASDGENPFVYGSGSAMLGDGTSAYGGSETFRIFPEPLTLQEVAENPFIEKVKYLDFLVSDGAYYSTKRITLRQQNYALLIDDELNYTDTEFLMGKTYSIGVTSNAPWNISVPSGSLGMLEQSEINGNTLRFRIRDDESMYGTTVPITFYSTDPAQYFLPVEVELKVIKNFPNCYLLQPGGSATIPTSHIYDLHEKLFGSRPQGTLSAEILWKDRESNFITTGYSNGSIWVQTSAAGNAVIAAKINGKVIWSWHLWVTSYNPETTNQTYTTNGYSNTFMTVNLGATSTSSNNVETLGLYYQWGRKDPFPGANGTGSGGNNNPRPVYDKNNQQTSVTIRQADSSNSLAYTVENPLTFITAPTYPYDWYTTSRALQDDYLWNDDNNYKTIFDPCPEGWRVPYIKDDTSPWDEIQGVNTSNNGVSISSLGGYHPLAGNMHYATGVISSIPLRVYLWAGTTSEETAYGMAAGYYSFNSRDIRYRANGTSIRCVRDE